MGPGRIMPGTVDDAINGIQATVKDGDYFGDDGLLYCGKCHTPKQVRLNFFGEERILPALCECAEADLQRRKEEREKREFERRVQRLRDVCFVSDKMHDYTFAGDDGLDIRALTACKRYVAQWSDMKAENIGLLFYGDVGTGKALTVDTDIITPYGKKKIADIRVGDCVIGWDGKPCTVIGEYPQGELEVYKLTFDDGTAVECCEDHLWIYKTPHSRNKQWRVASLKEMMSKHSVRGTHGWTMAIPKAEPVQFENNPKLPIKPYALGAMLGDGGMSGMQVTFTNPEEDVRERVFAELSEFDIDPKIRSNNLQANLSRKLGTGKENKLKKALNSLGLTGKHSEDKFIPKDYLVASIDERKELLAGLFDTDGSISPNGAKSISSTSYQMAMDIMELARSLGIRCTLRKPDQRHRNTCYTIGLQTSERIYKSKKHATRDKEKSCRKKADYMSIVSIERVGKKECKCIAVDNETKSYLCGDYIVTHNTYYAACIANALIDQGVRVLMTSFPRIVNTMQGMFEGRQEYLDEVVNYPLLIIDDLGAERDSSFMMEQVFNIIDARYQIGKPLIVTTNLSIEAIKKPSDPQYKRLYDRILERCFPVKMSGISRRRKQLHDDYARRARMLGLE